MSLQVLGTPGLAASNRPLIRADPVHGMVTPLWSFELLQDFLKKENNSFYYQTKKMFI